MKAQAITLQLTPLAKAKVWFGRGIPEFAPTGIITQKARCATATPLGASHVTLEALIPRGGRAEYGLLGISFELDTSNSVQIRVPYSEASGPPWPDSLAKEVDDVRIGLPREYAQRILDTIELSAYKLPSGLIRVVDAAYGLVGSSEDFFGRLTKGILALILDDCRHEDKGLVSCLKGTLLE